MIFNTSTAPEFAEGKFDFAMSHWRCDEHGVSLRSNMECPWCVSEILSPAEFDKWLDSVSSQDA